MIPAPAPTRRLEDELPLTDFHLRRLQQLHELAGGDVPPSWGIESANGTLFLDVAGRRFYASRLHAAIGEAERALTRRAA